MAHPELNARPRWNRTGDRYFPYAALVDGRWWVLRINPFPDHAHWTLFINGRARFDIDDMPPGWQKPAGSNPLLEIDPAAEALAPILHLTRYGSEVGDPCDDPFCCG